MSEINVTAVDASKDALSPHVAMIVFNTDWEKCTSGMKATCRHVTHTVLGKVLPVLRQHLAGAIASTAEYVHAVRDGRAGSFLGPTHMERVDAAINDALIAVGAGNPTVEAPSGLEHLLTEANAKIKKLEMESDGRKAMIAGALKLSADVEWGSLATSARAAVEAKTAIEMALAKEKEGQDERVQHWAGKANDAEKSLRELARAVEKMQPEIAMAHQYLTELGVDTKGNETNRTTLASDTLSLRRRIKLFNWKVTEELRIARAGIAPGEIEARREMRTMLGFNATALDTSVARKLKERLEELKRANEANIVLRQSLSQAEGLVEQQSTNARRESKRADAMENELKRLSVDTASPAGPCLGGYHVVDGVEMPLVLVQVAPVSGESQQWSQASYYLRGIEAALEAMPDPTRFHCYPNRMPDDDPPTSVREQVINHIRSSLSVPIPIPDDLETKVRKWSGARPDEDLEVYLRHQVSTIEHLNREVSSRAESAACESPASLGAQVFNAPPIERGPRQAIKLDESERGRVAVIQALNGDTAKAVMTLLAFPEACPVPENTLAEWTASESMSRKALAWLIRDVVARRLGAK
jgi:hypothetical protein